MRSSGLARTNRHFLFGLVHAENYVRAVSKHVSSCAMATCAISEISHNNFRSVEVRFCFYLVQWLRCTFLGNVARWFQEMYQGINKENAGEMMGKSHMSLVSEQGRGPVRVREGCGNVVI
jgi:hypothetical protein